MLLKLKAVAQELAVSVKTVRKLITAGALRGVKIGRVWRVDQEDLAVFVARRRT